MSAWGRWAWVYSGWGRGAMKFGLGRPGLHGHRHGPGRLGCRRGAAAAHLGVVAPDAHEQLVDEVADLGVGSRGRRAFQREGLNGKQHRAACGVDVKGQMPPPADAAGAAKAVQPKAAERRAPRAWTLLVWMRAMIWGMTASHVSIETSPKPSCSASSTSGAEPLSNRWALHREIAA